MGGNRPQRSPVSGGRPTTTTFLHSKHASILKILCTILVTKILLSSLSTLRTTSETPKQKPGRNLTHTSETPASITQRGILMSCPVGPSETNHGSWKPTNMAQGIEAVIQQLIKFRSELPLFILYYEEEEATSQPFCEALVHRYSHSVKIHCLRIAEKFPKSLYGYAKIFAIRRVPVEEVLWIDCDVFPVRDLMPLFRDPDFRDTGAMFWPDSRDHFDESRLASVLKSEDLQDVFPMDAWWVAQGFDSGLLLVNRSASAPQLRTLSRIARSEQHQPIRLLSMGDKDLFHIVWMMHRKNFTLVPYVGETGHFEVTARFEKRTVSNREVEMPVDQHAWLMSSQVKYGRDGHAYALHQLHRERSSTFRNAVRPPSKRHKHVQEYVEPTLTARKDLRLGRRVPWTVSRRKHGDFLADIEFAFLRDGARRKFGLPEAVRRGTDRGLWIADSVGLHADDARAMDRAWVPSYKAEAIAKGIARDALRRRQ